MKKLKVLALALMCAAFSPAKADEGMWLLQLMQEQHLADRMKAQGMSMDVADIYNPGKITLKDAVGIFGRGCTGEIISADGLILTNHHCGYGAIQQHSSVEHDYLTNGFWAKSRSEELPTPGLTFKFVERIVDLTDRVNADVKAGNVSETESFGGGYLAKLAKEEYEKSDLKGKPGIEVEALPFYAGNKFYLFYIKTYTDVRMVAAPPSSIGKFGGETDNWMWPRHTGDFSMFRIYADKNGKPANYSAENVPLKVKKHLTINIKGVKEGDFTFVMGFPGRNWRYMISDEVEERMQTTNFMRDTVRGVRLNVLGEEMAKDAKTRIQYAAKYASSANYWKNAIGMNEGLVRLKVLDRKRAEQERLLAYAAKIGNNDYREAYETIKQIVAKRHDAVYHQQAIYEALMLGTEFSKIPDTDKLHDALVAKDKEGVQKAVAALRKAADKYFNKDYSTAVDRKVSKQLLAVYANLIPAAERISIFATIDKLFKGSTDAFIDACFDKSIFRSHEAFNAFLDKANAKTLESDLMVRYAKSVIDGYKATDEAMKAETNAYNRAHKTWVAGMMTLWKNEGKAIYPDANSTLRLTYGKIGSYTPADGIEYLYYTTLKGVMEKEDPNNPEFVVPAKLKELYAKKDFGPYAMADGRMPVCFVTATDNTGGNSGSPVFNSKGELCGLGFDRNYEGLTGDIAYNQQLQRAACVDIRYVLFVIDKYAGATHLIEEMDIIR
jgi:hypothetical protein